MQDKGVSEAPGGSGGSGNSGLGGRATQRPRLVRTMCIDVIMLMIQT